MVLEDSFYEIIVIIEQHKFCLFLKAKQGMAQSDIVRQIVPEFRGYITKT